MAEICCTCLSRNRILVSLDKVKYGSLFGSETVIINVESVCWECMSLFHKLHKFKLQVLRAQDCLRTNSTKVKVNLAPLTRLTRSTVDLNDICCEQNVENVHRDDNNKYIQLTKTDLLKQNVKSENECTDDTNNDSINQNAYVNSFLKVVFLKCDEPKISINKSRVHTRMKHVNDDDETLSDENIVEELSVSKSKAVTVKRRAVIRRTKQKLQRVQPETKINVARKVNKNENRKRMLPVTKDSYIITEMTEQEMQAKRQADRQDNRYKNIVKFRCESCIVGFFHKELYEKHLRNRHSEKAGRHQCTICETRFSKSPHYREHVAAHYREYRCRTCAFVGHKLAAMVSHDAREHGLRRFSCKVCRDEFPSPSSLRFHRETTHEAPLKCVSCAKVFRTKNGLRLHNHMEHSSRPLKACGVCGATPRHLAAHMLQHMKKPEAAYCAECDRRFASLRVYKNHLKYAAKHRPPDALKFPCSHCDYKFVSASALKQHVMVRHHHKLRPYKCDRCDKRFEAQCRMRAHILHDHEGVKKPKDKICHVCGRGFASQYTLNNHIRVHTGEKPFCCAICKASFTQKSSLTTHMRGVHLKIKPRPGTNS